MGAVYLVYSPNLPRREALKVLNAELAHDARMRTRFLQEADITASLEHRNIVSVFSRGETADGQLWMAMEYVSGTDAETALRAGTMTPQRALHIITEVSRALDYAHLRGVVHQDIKPSNFLLGDQPGEKERVVLSDFGVALTPQSTDPADSPMTATLAYAAPEVITGKSVDGRADVYSLGCTLFRLLTGLYPFPGHETVPAIVKAHLDQAPPHIAEHLPWATPQLDHVIAKALAKDPARRYPSAGQFAAASAQALRAAHTTPIPAQRRPWQPAPVPAPPPTRPAATPTRGDPGPPGTPTPPVDFINHLPRAQPVSSKRRILAGAGIAAAIVITALVVWLALPTSAPDPAPTSNPPSTTTVASAPSDTAAGRLARSLPAGYPAGTCTPTGSNTELAAAALSCGPNIDPAGPPTATYTLARNATALRAMFDHEVATATAVVCPGNIQSPGPWQRLANPTVPQGTLLCGIRDGRSIVAWTTNDRLLSATIEADTADGAALGQLYTWWARHS